MWMQWRRSLVAAGEGDGRAAVLLFFFLRCEKMLKARGLFLAKPFLSKQEECTKLGIGTEVRPKKFG